MNKEEFIKKINEKKLGKKAVVQLTNYTGAPNMVGCFQNNEEWVVYETDERGYHEDMIRTKSESEAFRFMYDYIIGMSFL